jgi:hypothetical protein
MNVWARSVSPVWNPLMEFSSSCCWSMIGPSVYDTRTKTRPKRYHCGGTSEWERHTKRTDAHLALRHDVAGAARKLVTVAVSSTQAKPSHQGRWRRATSSMGMRQHSLLR